MVQKTIRDFNNKEFTVAEAAEWHKELNDRTKSTQTGYNSVDELATKVKAVEAGGQTLSDGSVTTAKLASKAVSTAKIADGAVDTLQVKNDAIDSSKIKDNAVGAAALNVSGNGTTGELLKSDGDGSFSWVTAPSVSVGSGSIDYAKLHNEFKGKTTITPAASVTIDFSANAVFRLTPNANTTLNISNPRIGTKTIVLIGSGTAYSLVWKVTGTKGTPSFNLISGEFKGDSGVKYLISIECTDDGTNEEFWYTISKPKV